MTSSGGVPMSGYGASSSSYRGGRIAKAPLKPWTSHGKQGGDTIPPLPYNPPRNARSTCPEFVINKKLSGIVDRVHVGNEQRPTSYQCHIRFDGDAQALLESYPEWSEAERAYPFFTYSVNKAERARERSVQKILKEYNEANAQYDMFLPLVRHGMHFVATGISRVSADPKYWELRGVTIMKNDAQMPLFLGRPVVIVSQGQVDLSVDEPASEISQRRQENREGYHAYPAKWRYLRLRAAFTPSRYISAPPFKGADERDPGPEKLIFAHSENVMESDVHPHAGQLGVAHVEYHAFDDAGKVNNFYWAHAYGVRIFSAREIESGMEWKGEMNRNHLTSQLQLHSIFLAAANVCHEAHLRYTATRAKAVRAQVTWQNGPRGLIAIIRWERVHLNPAAAMRDTAEWHRNKAQGYMLNFTSPMSSLQIVEADPRGEERALTGRPQISLRTVSADITADAVQLVAKPDVLVPQALSPHLMPNCDYMVRGSALSPSYNGRMEILERLCIMGPSGYRPTESDTGMLAVEDQVKMAVVMHKQLTQVETNWQRTLEKIESDGLYAAVRRGTCEELLQAHQGDFRPQEGQGRVIASVIKSVRKTTPLLLMCDSPFGSGKTTVQSQCAYAVAYKFTEKNDPPNPLKRELPSDANKNALYHSTMITCSVNSAADESARRSLQSLADIGLPTLERVVEVLLRNREIWTAMDDKPNFETPGYARFCQVRAAFAIRVLSPLLEVDDSYVDMTLQQLPLLNLIAQNMPVNVIRLNDHWLTAYERFTAQRHICDTLNEIIANNQHPADIFEAIRSQLPLVRLSIDEDDEDDLVPLDDGQEEGVQAWGAAAGFVDDNQTWGKIYKREMRRLVRVATRLHKVVLNVLQPGQVHVTLDSSRDKRLQVLKYAAVFVDEASLADETAIFGAVSNARLPHNGLVLLFGDSKQLTRMVRPHSWIAPILKPDPSLINRLVEGVLCPILKLETVFRGHDALIQANSVAAYDGQLRAFHDYSQWRDNLPLMACGADQVPLSSVIVHMGFEVSEGVSVKNLTEVDIVVRVVQQFVILALNSEGENVVPWSNLENADSLLVVCFYSAQERKVIDELVRLNWAQLLGGEGFPDYLVTPAFWRKKVITADRAQAREAHVVIVSCVRGSVPRVDATGHPSQRERDVMDRIGFLAMLERCNVATSRAKTARVVIMNAATVLHSEFFWRFVAVELGKGRVFSYHERRLWECDPLARFLLHWRSAPVDLQEPAPPVQEEEENEVPPPEDVQEVDVSEQRVSPQPDADVAAPDSPDVQMLPPEEQEEEPEKVQPRAEGKAGCSRSRRRYRGRRRSPSSSSSSSSNSSSGSSKSGSSETDSASESERAPPVPAHKQKPLPEEEVMEVEQEQSEQGVQQQEPEELEGQRQEPPEPETEEANNAIIGEKLDELIQMAGEWNTEWDAERQQQAVNPDRQVLREMDAIQEEANEAEPMQEDEQEQEQPEEVAAQQLQQPAWVVVVGASPPPPQEEQSPPPPVTPTLAGLEPEEEMEAE